MKNNITELVFILDRSGSRAGLESERSENASQRYTSEQVKKMIEDRKKNTVGNFFSSVPKLIQLKQHLVMVSACRPNASHLVPDYALFAKTVHQTVFYVVDLLGFSPYT